MCSILENSIYENINCSCKVVKPQPMFNYTEADPRAMPVNGTFPTYTLIFQN